ncbi:MAG TPA: chorismate-binding protein [Pseudogracilibacillus sp.]|nr:chorismate-binding protein [Pseudogracilibacillus sp.]
MTDVLCKVREKHADTLTPVSIFKRLDGARKFLLESSFQHETKGRYSYIGTEPYAQIIGRHDETTVYDFTTGKKTTYNMNTLEYLNIHFPNVTCDIPLPFIGGAIGYVAYDAKRQFVHVGDELPDPLMMPDYHFLLYDTIIAYEHVAEKAHIVTLNVHDESEDQLTMRLENIERQLERQMTIDDPDLAPLTFKPQISEVTFIEGVKKAQRYIERGEAAQIVLSQRMIADIECEPFSLYRKLRVANPSPYMFYIDFGVYYIIGASPESLVHTTGSDVVTNPIAGTKPRGSSVHEEAMYVKELTTDPKEIAEHDMLVQMSKEDLSTVCEKESVRVPVEKQVVTYEHVMHLASEVHGTLRANKTSIDALQACLPAGTLSGFPRERAMQIINDIEKERRGFYGGGVGYVSYNGDINFAIAIRSLVIKDKKAYLQTGAGIVKDSVPESEYAETIHKAKSLTNLIKKTKEEVVQ